MLIAMAMKLLKDDNIWILWGDNGSTVAKYQEYIVLACAGLVLIAGIQGAITSRMYFAQCVCMFSFLSLTVGLLFSGIGAYFYGMYCK